MQTIINNDNDDNAMVGCVAHTSVMMQGFKAMPPL